ncbi:(2Fe-2S)-binding protein [Streptomyces sp. ODS28]|uniref:(2Fe-2S)-binding protein n=1 Tax=Streptomyces sp. ODS28 TaxID=3136688 RepID=UPI0031ED43B5
MYACSCFGVTEQQVREHAEAGACTPRQIASETKAGTDCGSCVRRIQGLLGRGECPRRQLMDKGVPALSTDAHESALAVGPDLAEEPAEHQQVAEAA